jgi:WD40 repeat protein
LSMLLSSNGLAVANIENGTKCPCILLKKWGLGGILLFSLKMSITNEQIYAPHPTPQRGLAYFLSPHDGTDRLAYGIDNVVYLRGLTNQFDVDTFIGHSGKVTAAAYSPSGRWVASADESGNVKVWTPQNVDKTIELEIRPISGPVFDITWTNENNKISVIGAGANNAYGVVLDSSTGSAQGEVIGHTKQVNTGCLKPTRPYRFVTAGDDFTHVFYKGPPFKFQHTCKDHDKFILCVRFSPDGSLYATVGLDGKVCLYDGKESTKVNQFNFPCGITAIAFSPDSKQALLSTMDGRALVINVADGAIAEEYVIGPETYQQQSGALWTSKHKMTISLNGDFNFLEDGKVRIERQHTAAISSIALIEGGFATGDSRGMVLFRKFDQSPYAVFNPQGVEGSAPHVNALATSVDKKQLYVASADKKIYVLNVEDASVIKIIDVKETIKSILPCKDYFFLLTTGGVFTVKGDAVEAVKTPFAASALAVSPNEDEICIGGPKGVVAVLGLDGSVIEQTKGHDFDVVALAYSPNGKMLASTSSHKDITVWSRDNLKEAVQEGWCFHSLQITKILFAADNSHLFTISGDRSIRQWFIEKRRKYVVVERAHQQKITDAVWIDEKHMLTTSEDGSIKKWAIELI